MAYSLTEAGQDRDNQGQEDMYAEGNQQQSTQGKETPPSSQTRKRCVNCDIDILWPPTMVQGKIYCCTGCAAGGPCNCDYSQYRSVNIAGVIHYGTDIQEQR